MKANIRYFRLCAIMVISLSGIQTAAQDAADTVSYYIQTEGTTALIFSLGGRHIIQSAGLDYGLIIPIISDMDSFIAFPWLGITIPFGNKQ